MRLSSEEARVIGSLIEKQLTTPQQYPLTVNALVLACNQTSNRDPIVAYDEKTVESALSSLKDKGLIRFLHPSHGRSVIRYRQVLEERLTLNEQELALLAVLLLRGPQTVGELRTRTERMTNFDGIAAIETVLEQLTTRSDELVVSLPRRPGQKEERWSHLLNTDNQKMESAVAQRGSTEHDSQFQRAVPFESTDPAPTHNPQEPSFASTEQQNAFLDLVNQVAALRREVDGLRVTLQNLQVQLDTNMKHAPANNQE